MYYDILPETLKTHRARLGWSQETLAEKAGVERRTIIKKERHEGVTRARDFVAAKIARALGVEVTDLAKPIPEEVFRLDVDVFAHLRRVLEEGDHYHAGRILDYVVYHLAESLKLAQFELASDWKEKTLNRPRPVLPFVPTGPLAVSHGEIDRDRFSEMLAVWHSTFGEALVNPDQIVRNPKFSSLRSVIKNLPVTENGRINIFWLKAYLRRASEMTISGYTIHKISSLNMERWIVVKAAE